MSKPTPSPCQQVIDSANLLRNDGRTDEAIQLLLTIAERDLTAISFLANFYVDAGRSAEAAKWLERGLRQATQIGVQTNFPARLRATDFLEKLGELAWEDGQCRVSIDRLTAATELWPRGSTDGERIQRAEALGWVFLSLARKSFDRGDYVAAKRWADERVAAIPDCSEGRSLAATSYKFLPRKENRNISVLLEMRHKVPEGTFSLTVLPYLAPLTDLLYVEFRSAVTDLDVDMAEQTQQLLISGNTHEIDRRGEIMVFIWNTWEEVTGGEGC